MAAGWRTSPTRRASFRSTCGHFPTCNGGQWQVSTDGGTQPLWARNGEELFYVAPDGTLSSVRVERGPHGRQARREPFSIDQYFLGAPRRDAGGCTTCRQTASGS